MPNEMPFRVRSKISTICCFVFSERPTKVFEEKGHSVLNEVAFSEWLPVLDDFRNWLMVSEKVEILKILTRGLPLAFA
jgi:hypothetical protein